MRILATVKKNTNFIYRVWFPQTIVFRNEDGTFDVARVGFGDKVIASVKRGANAPFPTLIYRRYDDMVKVWSETAIHLMVEYMGLDANDAAKHCSRLINDENIIIEPKDALAKHFGEAFTGRIDETEEN